MRVLLEQVVKFATKGPNTYFSLLEVYLKKEPNFKMGDEGSNGEQSSAGATEAPTVSGAIQQSLSGNLVFVTAASIFVASKILWNALFRQLRSKPVKSAEKDIPQSDNEATEAAETTIASTSTSLQTVGVAAI